MQVRALNGTYRDDLVMLDDRLAVLDQHASAAQRESLRRARTELGRYARLHPQAGESPQTWQRREDQQWHAVLCCLDEFLDRHAEGDAAS